MCLREERTRTASNMSESVYKEACNVYATCGETGDDYEEAGAVSPSGVPVVRRPLDLKNAKGTSEATDTSTDDVATGYIPGVGMRNPGQSRVWTSAVKKTISVLSIVLNCCLLGAVIFLGVTVLNLKLSMNQLEENTETTIADLSNVIEGVQKTLQVAEGISGAPGKRLTDSNLSGTLGTEHKILQRLEKLEAGIKSQQDESEEVHAATDRPVSFCPNGYQKYREVCYKAFDTRKKFHESAAVCRADGGTLAMPRDSGINAFLVSLIQAVDSYSNFWFGLHDLREDGKWEWIDGTELDGNDFNMWSEGRQASKNWTEVQNCVLYWWIDQYSWNDSGCLSIMKFICQIVPSDATDK